MTSISSANNIKERTTEFCSNFQKKSPNYIKEKQLFLEEIAEFIQQSMISSLLKKELEKELSIFQNT